jgi:hypothetical protein
MISKKPRHAAYGGASAPLDDQLLQAKAAFLPSASVASITAGLPAGRRRADRGSNLSARDYRARLSGDGIRRRHRGRSGQLAR